METRVYYHHISDYSSDVLVPVMGWCPGWLLAEQPLSPAMHIIYKVYQILPLTLNNLYLCHHLAFNLLFYTCTEIIKC